MTIRADSSLRDVAFAVCAALDHVGVTAVLTGGGAATLYAPEAIQSYDLDFVLTVYTEEGSPVSVLQELGYSRIGHSEAGGCDSLSHMKLPLWVAVTFVCATLGACQAQLNDPESAHPADSPPPSEIEAGVPTLEYIGTELRAYGTEDYSYYRFMDIIRFSNKTPVAWEFWGEDVTWPPWSRAFLAPSNVWQEEPRGFCATLFGNRRIEPGQVVLFPAHSTRLTHDVNSGAYSRVQLELTNAQSGEKALVFTEGYKPRTTNEDEALARELGP